MTIVLILRGSSDFGLPELRGTAYEPSIWQLPTKREMIV